MNICINCVKDNHLKDFIRKENIIGHCTLCGLSGYVSDTEEKKFFQLVKALLRFHYSEWDYNEHWGGDGYESLFYREDNIFFDVTRSISEEAYEEVVLSIVDGPVYEDYDKGVSIYAGYDADGQQNMLLQSISSDLDVSILKITERLKTENHFALEKEVKELVQKYIDVARMKIQCGEVIYRARVGFEKKKICYSNGFVPEFHFEPYKGTKIDAPPPYLAANGRANRAGVSFLYCATDECTALSEVRPHPGDLVSIGTFRVNKDIFVYDLSGSKLIHFFESDRLLDSYKVFNTLGEMMNKTIAPSERMHYSITQLITDCIRLVGFDGVVFNSTVGSGKNIVLFDHNCTEQLQDKASIVLVDSVKYKYSKEKVVTDDECYLD